MNEDVYQNLNNFNLEKIICVWKLVTEKDKDRPDYLKTIDPAKKCYDCEGNDYKCRMYLKWGNENE